MISVTELGSISWFEKAGLGLLVQPAVVDDGVGLGLGEGDGRDSGVCVTAGFSLGALLAMAVGFGEAIIEGEGDGLGNRLGLGEGTIGDDLTIGDGLISWAVRSDSTSR